MKKRQEKTRPILTVFLIAMTALVWWQVRKVVKTGEENMVEVEEEYSDGWQEVDSEYGLKVQKEDDDYRQTVVVTELEAKIEDLDKYIRGAKVAIPSLVINKQEDNRIEGWYMNQGKKIWIIQKIGEEHLVTGSYVNEDNKAEVEEVMAEVEEKLI